MLVYFLANSNSNLINCDLNFQSEFKFHYDEVKKTLNIKKNDSYLEDYWGENVQSLTTIAGDNGIGKTSILELIKDRFLWGFNHPDKTIIVLKKDEKYELYYDEELLREHNSIIVNNIPYDLNSLRKEEGSEKRILEDRDLKLLYIEKISLNKYKTFSLNDKVFLQTNTRLGKEKTMVFYTNHWNYTRRNRMYKHDVDTKKLDYIDNSIGYRIDSLITQFKEYEVLISNDMLTVNGLVQKSRFDVDYLFKLQEQEMINTLKYLKENIGNDEIYDSLTIPEEIFIYYDFLDSQDRSEFFSLLDDNKYLRFEKRENNFYLENKIYDFILNNNKILLKESMILALTESLFSNIDLIMPNNIKKDINILDFEKIYKISSVGQINEYLNDFNRAVIKTVESLKINEATLRQIQNHESLKMELYSLIKSYIDFIDYLVEDFFEKVDSHITETSTFNVNRDSETTRRIEIEVPIIKIDKLNSEIAYIFFNEYAKVKGKNKPLYFTWRGLSSGELQLLNLCTSLNSAIKEAEFKEILILLDEVEISLHPMLQKKFIKMLMNIFNLTKKQRKNIQIILTTHSPFVLSELPFDSLILLEKDEQGIVKIKNEFDDLVATLGANVHELFSHSFFLKDGLIGNYAKDKINEVAKNLLGIQSNLDQDYIKKFINQLGEPIIKAKLVELYEQKWSLDKPIEIKKIKDDIESLKQQLKSLEEKGE